MPSATCARCGRAFGDDDSYCGACGLPRGGVRPELEAGASAPVGGKQRPAAVMAAVAAVASVAIAGAAAFWLMRRGR
jgi:hypothetical protein